MRIVQLQNGASRRVALVDEPRLVLLSDTNSVYDLARSACSPGGSIAKAIQDRVTSHHLDYDAVYSGASEWKLLPPIDHPDGHRCMVSGTGLTHLGSAKNRQAMHGANTADLSDSMQMFRWGVEHGKPGSGQIGIAPEWFYKGNGSVLRSHGDFLDVPDYAEDGGEEGEIAGVYYIGDNGKPFRIGMATGNEFSDHKFEKKNYLNLAGSKLRSCSLGPELVIDPQFTSVQGKVKITRQEKILWKQDILTGEREMCHSLENIEHHHFKFEGHRHPKDLHVHYYGACSLSFGAGVQLMDGDLMEISFAGFGRPLCNRLRVQQNHGSLVAIQPMR